MIHKRRFAAAGLAIGAGALVIALISLLNMTLLREGSSSERVGNLSPVLQQPITPPTTAAPTSKVPRKMADARTKKPTRTQRPQRPERQPVNTHQSSNTQSSHAPPTGSTSSTPSTSGEDAGEHETEDNDHDADD